MGRGGEAAAVSPDRGAVIMPRAAPSLLLPCPGKLVRVCKVPASSYGNGLIGASLKLCPTFHEAYFGILERIVT